MDRGEINDEEANLHPQSNMLAGCLGMKYDAPPVDIHIVPTPASTGDV